MTLFLLFYSLFFIYIPTTICPPLHRLLRRKYLYYFALILSVFPIIVSIIPLLDHPLTETEKGNSLISLSPITFLLLYKKFDERSIKKYNRHIYFITKYGQDKETEQSKLSEWLLQFSLAFLPFLWGMVGSFIFKK